jgi:hypothetical protein
MRVLTALAIIALCLFVITRGWRIAAFAQAQTISGRSELADLTNWVAVPGVTSSALQATLARMAAVSDRGSARQRAERLTAVLSVRPLSSEEWLSLAEMRLAAGQPEKDVRSALLMSAITGPNEDYLMWQRGLFGILIWQSLPAEARRQAMRDLAGALRGVPLGEREISALKNLLSEKSAEARSQVADLLKVEGLSGTELGRVGL